MRVVLDINVVVSGIFWQGPPHEVLKETLQGNATLLTYNPILAEYRVVLERMAGDGGAPLAAKWNMLLTEMSELVKPHPLGGICRDPKDEKYLEAAVGGMAQALVSGDKDLLILKSIRGIPILSPRSFLHALRSK